MLILFAAPALGPKFIRSFQIVYVAGGSPPKTESVPRRLQSLYQITWMLLILFAAPTAFDRYKIRSKCEAFNVAQIAHPDEDYFCTSSDVATRANGLAICERLFTLAPQEAGVDYACPVEFEEPKTVGVWCAEGETACDDYSTAHKVRCPSLAYFIYFLS